MHKMHDINVLICILSSRERERIGEFQILFIFSSHPQKNEFLEKSKLIVRFHRIKIKI